MKKYSSGCFLLLVLTCLSFYGCIDNSDKPITPIEPVTDNNKTTLLTASPWKLSAYTVNPAVDVNNDGKPETDLYPIVAPDSCTKDDITVFKTDKTYTREEGATKCDSTAQQVFENGTWAFSNNSKKLILKKTTPPGSDAFDIVELSASNLIISFKDTTNGVIYTFTQTLKH